SEWSSRCSDFTLDQRLRRLQLALGAADRERRQPHVPARVRADRHAGRVQPPAFVPADEIERGAKAGVGLRKRTDALPVAIEIKADVIGRDEEHRGTSML